MIPAFFSCSELKLMFSKKWTGIFISLCFELCWRLTPKCSYTGWAHFFLERGQRGEIPISSDFTVERRHSIFLLNVYTFLRKFLSFSSLNNLWHFLEIEGNSSMFRPNWKASRFTQMLGQKLSSSSFWKKWKREVLCYFWFCLACNYLKHSGSLSWSGIWVENQDEERQ